jgi:hypothetical protein
VTASEASHALDRALARLDHATRSFVDTAGRLARAGVDEDGPDVATAATRARGLLRAVTGDPRSDAGSPGSNGTGDDVSAVLDDLRRLPVLVAQLAPHVDPAAVPRSDGSARATYADVIARAAAAIAHLERGLASAHSASTTP